MASLHTKMLGSALLAALVLIAVIALLGRPRESAPPQVQPRTAEQSAPAAPAPVPSPPAAPVSRSKGQTDWAFFFRAGDTLSRMADGSALGVVVRLERSHSFPDGSSGPAYVVRSASQGEQVFDADELERSARIESVRDVLVPPGRPAAGTARR
ncbi:MAG TPA: hypothetical protein VJX92_01380 [Methylomirabilota bacterium]|nr:hypothetical protein [Methylomirabilota bacterium]